MAGKRAPRERGVRGVYLSRLHHVVGRRTMMRNLNSGNFGRTMAFKFVIFRLRESLSSSRERYRGSEGRRREIKTLALRYVSKWIKVSLEMILGIGTVNSRFVGLWKITLKWNKMGLCFDEETLEGMNAAPSVRRRAG